MLIENISIVWILIFHIERFLFCFWKCYLFSFLNVAKMFFCCCFFSFLVDFFFNHLDWKHFYIILDFCFAFRNVYFFILYFNATYFYKLNLLRSWSVDDADCIQKKGPFWILGRSLMIGWRKKGVHSSHFRFCLSVFVSVGSKAYLLA